MGGVAEGFSLRGSVGKNGEAPLNLNPSPHSRALPRGIFFAFLWGENQSFVERGSKLWKRL